jgi:hypothetical protein
MIGKHFLHLVVILAALAVANIAAAEAPPSADIRGLWTGSAQGSLFGAKGTVYIVSQQGEDIRGIVEGGNMFGRAKFNIVGKIRGNHIFGTMEGHTFSGFLLRDGTIRGVFRASDGETFNVFLRRPYQYWPYPYGTW